MKVHEIMTRDVERCSTTTTLTQAATQMSRAACGAIPVLDPRDRVVGMITDRDISMALVNTNRKPAHVPAWEAMTRHVHTCGPEDDVRVALASMKQFHVRRLPVVAADGTLCGILSMDDIIVRALAPDAPTSADIIATLREILVYRQPEQPEPEVVI